MSLPPSAGGPAPLTRAVLAFAVTAALCPLVLAGLRRWRLVDAPNHRSSHDVPTPRGGGLAVMGGALAALSLVPSAAPWRGPLLVASVGSGLLGLVDDIRGLPALARLGAQGVVAAAATPLLLRDLGGPVVWRVLAVTAAVLWLVSCVNAFNFMDGINGIAAMQAAVAGSAWWAMGYARGVPALVWGGAILLGAAAGFAPFNFPRARVFLGDVGSYFVGAWLAVVVVLGLRAGLTPEAMVGPLAPALADTLCTLARRMHRGERLHEAHADHVYQRLVRGGWSHTSTTLVVGALVAACSLVGGATLLDLPPAARVACDGLSATLLVGYLLLPGIVAGRWDPRLARAQ